MIYAGNPSHALSRLLKTNNFPEFTGRWTTSLGSFILGMP